MGGFVLRRLLQAIPVLILMSIIVFSLLYIMPGDPAMVILGEFATPETVAALQEELGLNRPAVVQYFTWAGKAATGDLQQSLQLKIPVSEAIIQRLPVTVELICLALTLAIVLGLTAGVIAALNRNSLLDLVVTGLSLSGIAMPSFFFGILLMLLFGVGLRLLPIVGFIPFTQDPVSNLKHMVLPAGVLGIELTALVTRFTRSEMLEVLGQDYVRTARAKGLMEHTVIVRHVLRNALIPVTTLMGIIVGRLFSGTVIIETLFGLPGVGSLAVWAVFSRDLPLLQGTVLFVTLCVLLTNLLVDIAYGYLDPRTRNA